MHNYVIRRLLMMIPILFGVSLVVFFIMRMVPGDVATMILTSPTGDDEGLPPMETMKDIHV